MVPAGQYESNNVLVTQEKASQIKCILHSLKECIPMRSDDLKSWNNNIITDLELRKYLKFYMDSYDRCDSNLIYCYANMPEPFKGFLLRLLYPDVQAMKKSFHWHVRFLGYIKDKDYEGAARDDYWAISGWGHWMLNKPNGEYNKIDLSRCRIEDGIINTEMAKGVKYCKRSNDMHVRLIAYLMTQDYTGMIYEQDCVALKLIGYIAILDNYIPRPAITAICFIN